MIACAQFTIADLNDATSEVIVGTQTAATNAWTGNASFSELTDGMTILYWLPFAGTSSSATLNLTLSDGTTTGAKNVYINGTTRCSNHVAVGNITQMTYRVDTPVNGKGSYTGWWITRNQDTTTNYYDRINYKASVTAAGEIAAGRLGVFNSEGKLMLLSTTAFDVTKPILYVGTAYTTAKPTQTKGNRATDYTPAPEDAEESMALKLAAVRAQISTEADSIRSEVQASYALSSDMNQVRQQVGTLAQQTESNYTWSVTRINQLENDLDAATEATEEQLSILRTYMSFGEDGLVIGKTGNPFTFRVVNDRLAFYMNDTEVAYLSNNKLYVTQAEILSKLVIGKFAFEPQANGNLSLIFNG